MRFFILSGYIAANLAGTPSIHAQYAVQHNTGPQKALNHVDAFGDELPRGVCARLGTVRFTQPIPITAISFSPTGDILATAGGCQDTSESGIFLWQQKTGKLLASDKAHLDAITCIAYHPSGKFIATGSRDCTVRIGQADSLTNVCTLKSKRQSVVTALAYDPSGKLLAVGTTSVVLIWDVERRTIRHKLTEIRNSPDTICFSPSGGQMAAAGGLNDTVYIWETTNFKVIRRLDGYRSRALAFSGDGRFLLTGDVRSHTNESAVRAWHIKTGKQTVLARFKGTVNTIACSPKVPLVFSADSLGKIAISSLDDENLRLNTPLADAKSINAAAFSRDGQLVGFGGDGQVVRLWDIAAGKELGPKCGHCQQVLGIRFLNHGEMLVSYGKDNSIRFWDLNSGRERECINRGEAKFSAIAISPSESTLVALSKNSKLIFWRLSDYTELGSVELPEKGYDIDWARTGDFIAIRGLERVFFLDSRTKRIAKEISAQGMRGLAFSMDGISHAFGDEREHGVVLLRFLNDLSDRFVLKGLQDSVSRVSFSPHNGLLAAGGEGGSICLWDLKTHSKIRKLFAGVGRIEGITFSPDSRTIAACGPGTTVCVWEVSSGELICRLSGHRCPVNDVRYSPRPGILASASIDHTVLLWDMRLFLGSDSSKSSKDESPAAWWDSLSCEAPEAWRAIWCLVSDGERSLEFLKHVMHAAKRPTSEVFDELIKQLDSSVYRERAIAESKLSNWADVMQKELTVAATKAPSLEAKRRIDGLLAGNAQSRERLRSSRAIAALSYMDTPGALEFLDTLARGAEGAYLTEAALSAVQERKHKAEEK